METGGVHTLKVYECVPLVWMFWSRGTLQWKRLNASFSIRKRVSQRQAPDGLSYLACHTCSCQEALADLPAPDPHQHLEKAGHVPEYFKDVPHLEHRLCLAGRQFQAPPAHQARLIVLL